MTALTPVQIDEPEKLQLALQDITLECKPKPLNVVYSDGQFLYGHLVDHNELLLWKISLIGNEYSDPQFVILPESELDERTVLDMLLEACHDDAWS